LLDVGKFPIGPELGEAYSGHFRRSDPNRDLIFAARAARHRSCWLASRCGCISQTYRKLFFEDADIVDKFATGIRFENIRFYLNFDRLSAVGSFRPAQVKRLRRIAPSMSAAVARHFERSVPARQATAAQDLHQLFATSATFQSLTGREREVCLRILSDLSSEAISADLNISIHSILTYRKRAYERLGISSQNDLLGRVLKLLMEPRPTPAMRALN
jgi:DNA-binding CsgD family transcriptional regulator